MNTPVLNKIFGGELLDKFFTLDGGVTRSAGNAKKNSNTNLAERNVIPLKFPLYKNILRVVTQTGVQVVEDKAKKVSPEDISKVLENGGLFAENSILGHGINFLGRIEKRLLEISDSEIAGIFGLAPEGSLPYAPRKNSVVRMGNLEKILQAEKFEELVENSSDGVIAEVDPRNIFRGLMLEAGAAVLGNLLTQKDSFFKKILEAQETLDPRSEMNGGTVLITQATLVYSPEEVLYFSGIQKELYEEYTKIQGELNGLKKLVKDLLREKQTELDAVYSREYKEYLDKLKIYQAEEAIVGAKIAEIKTAAMKEFASLRIKLA